MKHIQWGKKLMSEILMFTQFFAKGINGETGTGAQC